MSEARLPIRIACSGLGDRDVFIVRSLLRILDGRRGQPWVFQEQGAADIIITPSIHKESDQVRLDVRRTPSSRFVLTVPNGVEIDLPSGMQAVHYPLRASELLDCFDRLEKHWPFAPPSGTANGAAGQATTPATETRQAQVDRRPPPIPKAPPPPAPTPSNLKPSQIPTQPQAPPNLKSAPMSAEPRLSQTPTNLRASQILEDPRLSQAPSNLRASQTPLDPRTSQLPEGRVLTVGMTHATGRGVLAHPATIGALMQALRSLRSSQEGERLQGRSIDIFDQLGWIGRLYNGRSKVYASRRFMLDRSTEPLGGRQFQWKFALSGLPPLAKNDALIDVDMDLFAWQLSVRFCYDFRVLDLPINAMLHLRRWPDFGVQPEFSSRPGVMLATALLTRQTMSLAMLHRESETNEADLACLLGVGWLCGWLRSERQVPKTSSQKAPVERTRFSAFVRNLRKALGLSSRR
ncbi:MAG: hypothetical protein LBE75_03220 [Burkholderiales bacterium]|jgi:hypothetical protein|nr:hypothetical protein [Burkholderiales bacterium]